jgi:hypothetical protein
VPTVAKTIEETINRIPKAPQTVRTKKKDTVLRVLLFSTNNPSGG